MLSRLTISNVALIESLDLEFSSGLNILSGETGAGKSIIIDSLMLLLGEKYDKSILRYGADKGFVEGVFDLGETAATVLKEQGFEDDGILIVTRRFNTDGKNDIRLNGKSVTAAMLRGIMRTLVDIYGQNDYQSLTSSAEQMKILNFTVRRKTAPILTILAENYKRFQSIQKELKELGSVSERARNMDMLRFQIDEISKAAVKDNEEDELIKRRNIISSAERIASALNTVKESLAYCDDGNAIDCVTESVRVLRQISEFSDAYSELYDRTESLSIELKDIAETAADLLESVDYNEKALEKIEMRLETLRSLKRKYGSIEQMNKFKSESEELLYKLENCSQIYETLQKEKSKLIDNIYSNSLELSKIRQEGAHDLIKSVESELCDLGMIGARLDIVFEPFPEKENCEPYITAQGMDKAEFHFSANAGQPLKQLAKVISGGEISRFCLALKVILGKSDDIPTMIFDEIDTGIGGKTGQEVAKKLAVISRTHQVLCVTHLPQIAAMADNHYLISKAFESNQTATKVSLLNEKEVVSEISRLSGSKDISAQADENAKEIKAWCNNYKKSL